MKNEVILAGSLNKYGFSQADYVWSINGICPTILAHLQGYIGHQINILEDNRQRDSLLFPSTHGAVEASKETEMKKLRIRKLTEGECYRLMGFERKDTEACRAAGQSKANIYHQAGDSIVTTVLMGIFGELIGADYETAITKFTDKLHNETEVEQ